MKKQLDEFANTQSPEQIMELMQSNQIWVNAFSLINPTDQIKLELANNIIRMINETKHREYGAKITYIQVATS